MADGRDIVEPGGILCLVISRNLVGVWIFGERLGAHPAADHDESGDAGTGGRLQALVVGITAGMGGAGGMAHQKNSRGVNADLIGVRAAPFYDACDVLARARIFGVAGEPVTDIEADDPVSGEVVQHVGVNLLGAVGMAVKKSAAMDEDDRGPLGVLVVGLEQIERL